VIKPSAETLDRCGVVYWLHLPSQSDVHSEGYVGVTVKTLDKRYAEHKYSARKGSELPVHCAIRKYSDNLIAEVIYEGSFKDCLLMEKELRPEPYIGYNICAGGEITRLGMFHSPEVKAEMSRSRKGRVVDPEAVEKMRAALRGKKRSAAAKANISAAARTRTVTAGVIRTREKGVAAMRAACLALRPWQHVKAVKETWLLADSIFQYISEDTGRGYADVAKQFDIAKPKVIVIVKKIKSGWIPSEDEEWLAFSCSSPNPKPNSKGN
jgi:hypothetical protein